MPEAITDPNISFILPPSGSATFNLHNKGTLTVGFARIYSSGSVEVTADYSYPAFPTPVRTTTSPGRVAVIPVRLGASAGEDTGIALVNLVPGTIILTLRNTLGFPLANASVGVPAGVHFASFAREVLPPGVSVPLIGTLTIESLGLNGPGQFAVTAIQFDAAAMSPVAVTAIP